MQKSFFYKIRHGEYPLSVTFWRFYILFLLALYIINLFVLPLLIDGFISAIIVGSILTYLALIYVFNAYIGIWRAATKYTGSKLWSYLAKFIVCIGVIFSSFSLYNTLILNYEFIAETDTKRGMMKLKIARKLIDDEIRINKEAPIMVDQAIRFDKAEFGPDIGLTAYCTIIDPEKNNINQKALSEWKKILITETCNDSDQLLALKHGASFRFVFSGQDNNILFDILIDKNKCRDIAQ